MSDVNDDDDIERQQKRRRICCNSPLPCLEDFLPIKILTEHDIQIMAIRSGTCNHDNCNNPPARKSSGETTKGEGDDHARENDDDDEDDDKKQKDDNDNHHENHDEHNDFLCSICLSEMKPGDKFVMTRQCQHAFHAACMATWLFCPKQTKHPSGRPHRCPNCRTEILPLASKTP
jgi:hypothetical protein